MIYNGYSPTELEEKAVELLRKFDSERLTKCKPLDVYEVIEKCLDVPYDWKYITPDQSILGLTAFQPGTLWIWPEPCYVDGMMPQQIYLDEGTIFIDSTLTEKESRGPENFTVMHEVFHQVLHWDYFRGIGSAYARNYTLDVYESQVMPQISLPVCEYQANTCAAAFLMPAQLVENRLHHYHVDYILDFARSEDRKLLVGLADEFSVSKTAMKYRLINLGHARQEYWG